MRKVPLVNGEVYHVFNRGLDGRETFGDEKAYRRMMLSIWFYLFDPNNLRLSHYLNLGEEYQRKVLNELILKTKRVELFAYCLMKNHFHLLVKQLEDNGISKYLAVVQNSYTRYFNTRKKRKGALFENQFKAVHVVEDMQLLHVSRYIHLNPFTGKMVDSMGELRKYEWSSLPVYVGDMPDARRMLNTADVLGMVGSREDYWEFIQNQADYQRNLKEQEKEWLGIS